MPQYGIVHLKFNIILLIWLTTAIPNILTSSSTNKDPASQEYDVIDVAKQQDENGELGRSKGHTTRIITTGDVDDEFWLKYLGEDFHHAVHLQVDDNSVRHVQKEERQQVPTLNTNKINDDDDNDNDNDDEEESKPIRFARQIDDEEDSEQIPVESTSRQQYDDNDYPTEEPEIFHDKSTTPTPTTTTTQTTSEHLHETSTNQDKHLKHKKIHTHNKNKKIKQFPSNPLKAIQAPIIVNLLETKKTEYEITEEGIPVVVQMPPVIYHQKAEIHPEIHHEHITNLHTKQRPIHKYPTHFHNTLDTPQYHYKHNPHDFAHHGHGLSHYSYQRHALPRMSLPQMKFHSFVKPSLNDGVKPELT